MISRLFNRRGTPTPETAETPGKSVTQTLERPEGKCLCPDCGALYSGAQGSGGHCRDGCHRTFANQSSGDAHRTGPYDGDRRCLTVTEMTDRDWRLTPRGWTMFPPMDPETLARRKGQPQ